VAAWSLSPAAPDGGRSLGRTLVAPWIVVAFD